MIQNETPTLLPGNTTDALNLNGVDRTALARLDLDTIKVDDLAAWLYDHGAAHLSAMERIELAERLTRRRFIIGAGGLLGAAALGACGTGEQVADSTVTTVATRTVEHALGTTEVPQNPQRVITLDPASTQSAVATGVTPIATPDGDIEPLAGVADLDGVESIGFGSAPNLEKIAALNPDLILGPDVFISSIYDQLSQIAPTVAFARALGPEWKDLFLNYAGALGQTGRARELLDEYEMRVQGFGQRVREATGRPPNEITVSLIRIRPDAIRVYLPNSFTGSIMAEVGLSRPEGQQEASNSPLLALSREEIPDLAADHIIQFQTDGDTEVDTERVFSNPLWEGLEAVRQGNFHRATNGEWYLEGASFYANFVLDDLERFFIEGRGATRGGETS
ncbi:MAG: iron-siderophore ABC transporter substrate-binding protein [Chloroflexales bacterium]|nr:iron-siderophore ABC transporter substrate-binding protein [Chloroflexales bacterium]